MEEARKGRGRGTKGSTEAAWKRHRSGTEGAWKGHERGVEEAQKRHGRGAEGTRKGHAKQSCENLKTRDWREAEC
jgi:hypothetical protein